MSYCQKRSAHGRMSAARDIRKKPWNFRLKPLDIREKPLDSTARGVYPFQTKGYTPLVQKGYTLFDQRGLPLGHKGVYPPWGEGVYPFAAKGSTPWVWRRGGLKEFLAGFSGNAKALLSAPGGGNWVRLDSRLLCPPTLKW